MLRIAVAGYGNVGRGAYEAALAAKDMQVVCVAEAPNVPVPGALAGMWVTRLKDINKFGGVDAAILALPSRMSADAADELLSMGINTVDAFDAHEEIWATKCRLDATAKIHGVTAVISAGWDPGTDSVIRALFEAMAPNGLSYTSFGPGMSMGHTVIAKTVRGVKNALSMTMPAGAGIHRRMVYVELDEGAALDAVAAQIKSDPAFSHDETHVIAVEDVKALLNVAHGVEITRAGVSGSTHNQSLAYSMKINNPALTGQILVSAARAAVKGEPGCYTLLEIPIIDLLPGEREELIKRLA